MCQEDIIIIKQYHKQLCRLEMYITVNFIKVSNRIQEMKIDLDSKVLIHIHTYTYVLDKYIYIYIYTHIHVYTYTHIHAQTYGLHLQQGYMQTFLEQYDHIIVNSCSKDCYIRIMKGQITCSKSLNQSQRGHPDFEGQCYYSILN